METAVFDENGKTVNVLKFSANKGLTVLPPRFKSAKPRFLKLVELRRHGKKDSPMVQLDFYEYDSGKMNAVRKIK